MSLGVTQGTRVRVEATGPTPKPSHASSRSSSPTASGNAESYCCWARRRLGSQDVHDEDEGLVLQLVAFLSAP